jgi:3-phenylpropionate/trans-cinnamate dioxygenase ferredoxin subunit
VEIATGAEASFVAKHLVAKRSEVAPGSTRRIVADSVGILLCNVDGTIYAIEDVCTHDGGPLDQGTLEGETVVCPRHGATFDVRTGDALTLPAVMPLMTFEVSIEGDDVYVEA